MNVAAIIVTRGDQDLRPVLASLPEEWERLVWVSPPGDGASLNIGAENQGARIVGTQSLSVYGRYAAIEYTDADLIYVQDDDCVVSDPQAIVDRWLSLADTRIAQPNDVVVCNMPPEFRHEFYEEHALVGFGACFHRDAPKRAFKAFRDATIHSSQFFNRTCDIVFTALTPRVLVEVPTENLPWAYHYTRMYRQPEHQAERVRMLDLVREIA